MRLLSWRRLFAAAAAEAEQRATGAAMAACATQVSAGGRKPGGEVRWGGPRDRSLIPLG